MAPEIEGQDEGSGLFEIVPEAAAETIEDFIKSLDDDFEYQLSTNLSTLPEETEIPDDDDDDDDDPEVPANDPTPTGDDDTPPELPDGYIFVKGQPVALADVERLYEFDQFLRNDPDASQRVAEAVKQPVVPVPNEAPPATDQAITPPDFLDLDDPAHKFMWDTFVSQQTQLASIAQRDAAREQETINRKALLDMDAALTRWRGAHPNFNDDQVDTLRQHAAQMNIIGAVMATTPDPVDALYRVLDIGAMDDPTLRTVYLAPPEEKPTPTRQQKSATRKRQLSALGGSSGSIPRTSPASRPMSDRDAIDQFAQGLAESFQSN